MALTIASRKVSSVVILDITGRLEILQSLMHDTIKNLLNEGSRCFVLNLSGVTYVDSSGLGQLVSAWTSIRNVGGKMVLLRPSSRVQQLLEMTKLTTLFQIFEDEAQAVAATDRMAKAAVFTSV